MSSRSILPPLTLFVVVAVVLLTSCGDDAPPADVNPGPGSGSPATGVFDLGGALPRPSAADAIEAIAIRAAEAAGAKPIAIDYPLADTIYPPDLVAPTFLWHDDESGADLWLIEIAGQADRAPVLALVPGERPAQGEIDPEALGPTNEVYELTPEQASAHAWTPSEEVWNIIRERHAGAAVQVTVHGLKAAQPDRLLSRGTTGIRFSTDPVGAPIFYRDVPLMPARGERGRVQPLAREAYALIGWRLRDLSQPQSALVLQRMESCGNCHSFSADGKTFGMDVDGPQGDKGTYAIKKVAPKMSIEYEDVITWNSFPDKPKGHKTIGFLSRVSPDGRYVMSTLNEALYVSNFLDYKYLQVFYPTRGILAYYDTHTQEMKALPGADDPEFVHTNGVWSPDGKWIVFSRAKARDPYDPGKPLAAYPNDPNEVKIQYDLYRIPFNGGKGGEPEKIAGASENGMSNTFPKVSPDGKWIVFTQCRNGQLMRPDGRLWIVPFEGGEARDMRCNTENMNSWHSFSPNNRWMVFSSKINTPYTQMFLTHIDAEGNDSPAVLVPNSTAANRAVNIPEFLNGEGNAIQRIDVPAIRHQVVFWEAMDKLMADQPEEAVRLFEQALELEPDFARGHAALGRALDRLGKTAKAIERYERALEIDPMLLQTNNELGVAMEKLGRMDRALTYYIRALNWDPEFHVARRNLIRTLLKLERTEQAAAHALELLKYVPEDEETRWLAIDLLLRVERADLAIPQLEIQVERHRDDVKALSLLAWQLATNPNGQLRDGPRAVTLAQRALQLAERPEPMDALAAALAETGRYDDAIRVLEDALARLNFVRSPFLAGGMRKRIEQYRAKRPWRDS